MKKLYIGDSFFLHSDDTGEETIEVSVYDNFAMVQGIVRNHFLYETTIFFDKQDDGTYQLDPRSAVVTSIPLERSWSADVRDENIKIIRALKPAGIVKALKLLELGKWGE